MLFDELDILECRLTELQDIPNLKHVIVEAEVAHRGYPKPLYFMENRERFAPWKDRIIPVIVKANGLPSLSENTDPWSREYAQREYAREGLKDAAGGDWLLHGDADEIPSPSALQAVTGSLLHYPAPCVLQQRLCQYAVDWVHPFPWHGTIITRVRSAGKFAGLRDMRNALSKVPGGGTHLSWMGGTPAHVRKLDVHCHLEMTQATEDALRSGEWLREGRHSDGHKLIAVDADERWPRWVRERKCPESWWRPREEEGE